MKIKKILDLNAYISFGAFLLIVLSLVWSYRENVKVKRGPDLVEEIRNVAFERMVLQDDFILHAEERAKTQWHVKSEALRRLLDAADRQFTSGYDRDLLREARKDFNASQAAVSSFMGRHERKEPGGSNSIHHSEAESILIGQAFLKTYSLMDSVNRLDVSAERKAASVRERSIVTVVFFLLIGIAAIIRNSAVINRVLSRRIAELGKEMEAIGAGNLDHRIDPAGDDELSALARGANEMAEKLKVSYVSMENLQREIAERERSEETARRETSLRGILLDNLPCIALILKKQTREIVACNAIAREYGAVVGKTCHDTLAVPGTPCPFCLAPEVWKVGESRQVETEYMGKFWHWIWVPFSEDLYIHYIFEITERKAVEREKERLQAQLLQATKMEAVGRLAGGVAHDFNNLLTVITGYSELLRAKVGKDSPMHGELEEIQRAGERASLLTQQLLAFSRKQIIEPKVVRPDRLVTELQKMLSRLIGENIDLQTTTGKALGSVKVDPGQFQQILMNLVVNARDAMPEGGKIGIETANAELDAGYCATHPYVKPGRYVMLAVSDTGQGMDTEVKSHIFEPFFTTKEKGKGTGLGLATTYGAVKQSGGSIEVYSEVGVGTTVKIYLPRVEEEEGQQGKGDRAADLPRGTETVLLVEDEESLRTLGVRILKDLGYGVLEARNGDEGLALAMARKERIDLLLTDVVMPGMGGKELATRLVAHHPETKVLFTSGYTDDAIVRHGVLDEGVLFLGKPYTPSDLARKVRDVLGKA